MLLWQVLKQPGDIAKINNDCTKLLVSSLRISNTNRIEDNMLAAPGRNTAVLMHLKLGI